MVATRLAAAALLAIVTALPVSAQQTQSLTRFQNRFRPATYLHTEQGSVQADLIQPGWWSADWIIEPVEGAAPNVRIRNRFRPTHYIHIEHGQVESGPLGDPGWWSAQWTIDPVAGTTFVRIRNRWKPGEYLHTERGGLMSGPIDQGWWSAMWSVQTRNEDVAQAPPPPMQAAAPAAVAIGTPVDVPGDDCNANGVGCSDMSDPTVWKFMPTRAVIGAADIPASAYVAGFDPENGGRRKLYVCVAYFTVPGQNWAQRFPGKTGPSFQGCNVPMNGREIVVRNSFLLLLNPLPGPLNEMAPASWVAASGGALPGRGIQTFGGIDLCRAQYQGGLHPGRLIPGRGCGIGYGGAEVVVPNYEALVRPGAR